MRDFFEWIDSTRKNLSRPWLMFGKGPSFALRTEYNLNEYHTITLNHTVREQKVLLAHIIDYEVVDQCGESLLTNADYLVMPFYPHINGDFGGTKRLDELVQVNETLKKLDSEGRLLWYNLSSCKKVHANSRVVEFGLYSGGCVLNLLAAAGVRELYSLGVDGGVAYSKEFDHMKNKTHENLEKYNVQFKAMAKTIMKTGIKYSPLHIESPVRIFVGTCEDQMLATKVLEYSILKNASLYTEVIPMHESDIEIPMPKAEFNRPRTPFSLQRFLIPQLREYKGKAIYMDSDMLVFRDIRSLWTLPYDGADLLYADTQNEKNRSQFSVMLLDCNQLRWNIEEIVEWMNKGLFNYEELMFKMCVAKNPRPAIDNRWNSIEHYEENMTCLIHYTYMKYQPWISKENKFGYLWIRELVNALKDGFITIDFVKEHVAKGYVRPSLLYQVDNNIEDASKLPDYIIALDDGFSAPLNNSWLKYQRTI